MGHGRLKVKAANAPMITHMPTNSITCRDCGKQVTQYSHVQDEPICFSCLDDNYSECTGCGEHRHRDDLDYCDHDNPYCLSCECTCYSDEEDDGPFRATDERTDQYLGQRRGRIVKSLRPFGVEIECYLQGESRQDILDEMPRAVGVGPDRSLGRGGIEIRSPRLSGFKGEQLIRFITNRLDKYCAKVNRSCGLHIHLDTADVVSVIHLRNLWALYLAFEDVLFSLLPPSRRGNRYCLALRRYFHAQEILESPTRERLEEIWYRARDSEEVSKLKVIKSHSSRYIGLNLHSLFHANHAEIRYHSGTTDPEKILQWVNLHALLFDKAKKAEATRLINSALDEVHLARKSALLFDFLQLSRGSREYLAARQRLFADSNPT
jgi:hypothetical protein